jgi:hypothetical protein
MNPWQPITKSIDLKHLGKLGEESGELNAVISRCIIQGLNSLKPDANKTNRMWLEEEIADVLGNIELVIKHFELNRNFITARSNEKIRKLKIWHGMLND